MVNTSLWVPSKLRVMSGHSSALDAEKDLDALLARMRRRSYPETMPVLGSYWLKTVYAKGHKQRWWDGLNGSLKHVIREEPLDESGREVLIQIQDWIQQTVLRSGKTPDAAQVQSRLYRSNLAPERLTCYVRRLLNQWMPAEVAYLLTTEGMPARQAENGIPVQAIAKAIERLLLRDCLSPVTLEMLLQSELLAPHQIYPADAEILRDVALALLGQTWAPAPPVMPVTLLTLAPESPLPTDYPKAVRHAFLVEGERSQEIHVPIAEAQALEMLKHDSMRIASTLLTVDGRWWESKNLEGGEQNAIEYTAAGLLRIDFSSEHARLALPLPYQPLHWSDREHLPDSYEVFGREWRVASWEMDGERTWAHLVFSRLVPTPEVTASSDNPCFRGSHPAFIDMAWSAMADAIASSLVQKNQEPIQQLRRGELIPLGRAICGFAETAAHGKLRKRDIVETQLRGICYLEAEVSPVYGRAPWAILPAPVQRALLKSRLDTGLLILLDQAFVELPQALAAPPRKGPESVKSAGSTSPREAA